MTKSFVRFIGGLFLIGATIGSGAAIGIGALSAGPAGAVITSPLVVDNNVDSVATPSNCTTPVAGECTLRDAVAAATAAGGAVTITLPSLGAGEVYNVDSTLGYIDVSGGGTVTINGGGQASTILEATNGGATPTTRVLKVESGTVADISGVTVEDGVGNNGGGILDCGDLSLTGSTVTGNTASQTGGGIELSANGSATLTDDTISGNTANGLSGNAGGGIAVENASLSAASNLTLEGTTVTANNTTNGGGGGLLAFNTAAGNDPNLTVFIDNSTVSDNTLSQDDVTGAGIDIQDGTWTVQNSTITGNGEGDGTDIFGGGVFVQVSSGLTETFTDDLIANNNAYEGAGVLLAGGNTTFVRNTVSGNIAAESGAGFFDETEATGLAAIVSSTISGNTVTGISGVTVEQGSGGAFLSIGCNKVDLTNDTISGNSASTQGGGYYGTACGLPASGTSTALLFDTITNNSTGSATGGGNIQQDDASIITIANTIVAGGIVNASPTTNCEFSGGGTFTSGGYNLIDDSTCGTPAATDIIGKSPQLGPLGSNGGPTQTELPGAGSPAISAIPAAVCSGTGVSTDQRGNARGAGTNGSCTIGSVEVAVPAPPAENFNGYRMVADEGGIFDFGLNFNGSLALNHLNAPIIGIANSPGPNGYLMAGSDGGVFTLGGAKFFGSLCCNPLPSPIAAIAATPSEDGYWLAAQNGKIYNFGDTPALPAVQVPSDAHIVGMASTNDGKGLWLTDQLGDVYAVGDALYLGGMGGIHINAPVVGIAAAATGQGYILAASDGGTFNFGVGFFGSVPGSLAPGQHLVAPIVGIAVTHSGNGYWMVGADGGLFNYGDAPFLGSIYTAIPGQHLNGPIVGIQHLGAAPPG